MIKYVAGESPEWGKPWWIVGTQYHVFYSLPKKYSCLQLQQLSLLIWAGMICLHSHVHFSILREVNVTNPFIYFCFFLGWIVRYQPLSKCWLFLLFMIIAIISNWSFLFENLVDNKNQVSNTRESIKIMVQKACIISCEMFCGREHCCKPGKRL